MDQNKVLLQQGVAKLLSTMRCKTGWTQKLMGLKLDFSESYISLLESQKKPASLTVLFNICKLFKLTMSELMLYLDVYAMEKRPSVIESITERLVERLDH